MMDSREYVRALVGLQFQSALKAKREQILERSKDQAGKYDRALLEHALHKPNPQLDEWLQGLLVDAALEKRDKVAFDRLTESLLEGW